MGKYCDTKVLERTWSSLILAKRVPSLEELRETGLLWSKEAGSNKILHCIASAEPYEFATNNGITEISDIICATKASFFPLDLIVVQRLVDGNYLHEVSATESWRDLTLLIHQICCGVALNFRPPSEDAKNELIQEALIHTLTKIQRGKLKFDPGRAPVFNLLTTAIFRIMYSIKNKERRDRDHKSQLVERLLNNTILPEFNSISVSKSLVCS